MIRYRLKCKKSHEFEAWFRNGQDYDAQAKRGLVECPTCGSKAIAKAPMAPRIARSRGKSAAAPATEPTAPVMSGDLSGKQREIMQSIRKLRDEMLARSEYVGPRFADEARRIHLNEAKARGIHGEASAEDVKKLKEEGVEVYPVPVLPEDRN